MGLFKGLGVGQGWGKGDTHTRMGEALNWLAQPEHTVGEEEWHRTHHERERDGGGRGGTAQAARAVEGPCWQGRVPLGS